MKPFRRGAFKSKTIFVHIDEESLAARRTRIAGTCVLEQVHRMQLLTRWPLSLPTQKRKHYAGSNKGNCIGPIALDDWDKVWSVAPERKSEIYGRTHRIAVGGATVDGDEDGENDDDDMELDNPNLERPKFGGGGTLREPVFYQTMPTKFYEDCCHLDCLGLWGTRSLTLQVLGAPVRNPPNTAAHPDRTSSQRTVSSG